VKKAKKHFLRDHFLPHRGNKHTPHAIGHTALFGYSVALVFLKFFALSAAIALPAASLFSSAITPTNIISLTNETRKNLDLGTLHEDQKLDASAQNKAEDMMVNQYFAHNSPSGVTPWSWIKGTGYQYKYAGENLAVYFTQAEDVNAGWMASPTHRANIVDTRYSDIGVGVAQGTYNGYPAVFVVEHFGKSSSIQAPAEPILEANVSVTPAKNSYSVALTAPTAVSASAHLGNASVELKQTSANTWQGSVPYDKNTVSKNGEPLTIVTNGTGAESVNQVALVAPGSTPQDVYAFESNSPKVKVLGVFSVNNLQDTVTKFYLAAIVFLSFMLIITLMAKMHWRRLPLAVHVIAVIGIATALMVI
jgi:hypothetical protein